MDFVPAKKNHRDYLFRWYEFNCRTVDSKSYVLYDRISKHGRKKRPRLSAIEQSWEGFVLLFAEVVEVEKIE